MSSAAESPAPIQIHIPASLQHHAIPLQQYLVNHPEYKNLVVGAFIFSPVDTSTKEHDRRLLIIQRAATERGFPNRWEVPGGGSEGSDPTILHSVAREAFEETGLRLTRFVRQIGQGQEFGSRQRRYKKLNFEIEVAELRTAGPSSPDKAADEDVGGDVEIILNPDEHQAHAWAIVDEIANGKYPVTTADQRQVMIESFQRHEIDH